MPQIGIIALLQAKPGKEGEVAALLRGAEEVAVQEPATQTWYAFQSGPLTFGIFDTFEDDAGRDAHLSGQIAATLTARASDLLSEPPDIRKIELIAVK
jgi:quinol monooxygenase YgiN